MDVHGVTLMLVEEETTVGVMLIGGVLVGSTWGVGVVDEETTWGLVLVEEETTEGVLLADELMEESTCKVIVDEDTT